MRLSVPIYVTRPYLPPLEEMLPLLEEIWQRRVLTNKGPFHECFEERLRGVLDVDHVSLVANGSLALSLALEAAGIEGEVITTPYSFVATTHSLRMSGLRPKFVDIRSEDFTIDPSKIEQAITPGVSAIVAVHVYGNPCAVEEIERIAVEHGLAVIYDAAHAFGVRYKGRSLIARGDFSTLSFHATKAFNTFEGGAVVSARSTSKQKIDNLRNFGIADEVTITGLGTNAKMSEFNAALGLLQLQHFEGVRSARRQVDERYRALLSGIEGLMIPPIPPEVTPNYSYFPVLVRPQYRVSRDELYEELRAQGIYSRRYFYPLLSNLPMYRELPSASPSHLPVANEIAEQILCLPIYPDMAEQDQERVVSELRAG